MIYLVDCLLSVSPIKPLPVLYLCAVTGNDLAPLEQIYCDHTALLLAHGVFLWPWRILCLFSMCVWFFSSKSQKYHSPQPCYSWNLKLEACLVCHQAWREGIWGHIACWTSAGVLWAEGASFGMVYIHILYVEQTYLLAMLSLLSRGTSWLPAEQSLRISFGIKLRVTIICRVEVSQILGQDDADGRTINWDKADML